MGMSNVLRGKKMNYNASKHAALAKTDQRISVGETRARSKTFSIALRFYKKSRHVYQLFKREAYIRKSKRIYGVHAV